MCKLDMTVIIPAFKAEGTIRSCLLSVLAQPEKPKIVVVVDGLLDGTAEIAASFPDVTVLINERNEGAPYSRNRGLALAGTEFVAFLDADDLIEGDLHAGMVAALQLSGADMVFTPWSWEQGSRQTIMGIEPVTHFADNRPHLIAHWMNASFVTGAMGWRTSALREVGGWAALPKGQDFELGLRCLLSGMSYCASGAGRYVYVDHNSSDRISRSKTAQHMDLHETILSPAETYASNSADQALIYRAIGRRFYTLACKCFLEGDYCEGRRALRNARRLGFVEHAGSRTHIAMSRILGLAGKQTVSRALSFANKTLKKGPSSRRPGS